MWSDVSVFEGIPDGVVTLEVDAFKNKAYEALMRALRRQTKVTSLKLTATSDSFFKAPPPLPAGASNPVVAFPKLQSLYIGGFGNLDALLDAGHRSLETLTVASLEEGFSNRDAGKPSPLHAFVDRLCAAQQAQSIRFPAPDGPPRRDDVRLARVRRGL